MKVELTKEELEIIYYFMPSMFKEEAKDPRVKALKEKIFNLLKDVEVEK